MLYVVLGFSIKDCVFCWMNCEVAVCWLIFW